MQLWCEFESVRSNLMNHPTPPLDICLSEFLHEEQQCQTQATLEQQKGSFN